MHGARIDNFQSIHEPNHFTAFRRRDGSSFFTPLQLPSSTSGHTHDTTDMFLFKSKQFDPDRFESELKKLTTKISYHEKKLRRLTTQRQHYRKVLPMYFIAVYLVYFSYLYQMKLLRLPRNTVKLILAPIIFGALYYGLLTVYSYLVDNSSAYVDALKEQHAEKLSTLKEKTNFDKTKELLARFSDGEDLQALEQEADEVRRKKQEYIKMIQEGDKGKCWRICRNNRILILDSTIIYWVRYWGKMN